MLRWLLAWDKNNIMALEFTNTLLQAQRELGKANRPIQYGKLFSETVGKEFKNIQTQLKEREDEFLKNKQEFDNLELTEEDYAGAWNAEMIAQMSKLKNEYNDAAITVKRTRNTNSKEYIDALAKMNRIQGSLGETKAFVDEWDADSQEFAQTVEEGRVSRGLSFNQRAQLMAYHNAASSRPVFTNNKMGIEYTWVDKNGTTRTNIAYRGQTPDFFEPATEEITAINDKYLDAVEKIGKGTFNTKAWTQDMRNFVNTMDYDALRSIAGDFSSVNGNQSFSQHKWVKDAQARYEQQNPGSEYDQWWQDPAQSQNLKEGLVQFFNDVYLPQFREFIIAKDQKDIVNNAIKGFSLGNRTKEDREYLMEIMQNDIASQAVLSTVDGIATNMYADQITTTLGSLNLQHNKTGAPMRIGFVMDDVALGLNANQADYEEWQRAISEGDVYNGYISKTADGKEIAVTGDPTRELQAGDYIVFYPADYVKEDYTVNDKGERVINEGAITKYQPIFWQVPEGIDAKAKTRMWLLQQMQNQNMVLNFPYIYDAFVNMSSRFTEATGQPGMPGETDNNNNDGS